MELAKKQNLVAKDFNSNWKDSKIYFNDQITSTNITLFYKARTSAKGLNYKYIWFKNNNIFVKTTSLKQYLSRTKTPCLKYLNYNLNISVIYLSIYFVFSLIVNLI